MAGPAELTSDATEAGSKAPSERKRRKGRKASIRPRIVRTTLLAVIGAACGVSAVLAGFYDVTVWGPIAVGVLALTLALVAIGAGRPRLVPAVAVGALVFLWLWSWLSSTWAESPDGALNYAGRWAFYAAALASLLLLMRRREERWIPLAFATAGIVGVGLYVVIKMGFGNGGSLFFGGRLLNPLGYVNGQAGYFLIGFWPCVALAEQNRRRLLAGIGAAGALVLASLMMLSQTRGVIPGLVFSGLIVLAVVPGRARRILVLTVIGLALAAIGSPLLDVYNHGLRASPSTVAHAGKAILLAAVLLAFAWWFVGLVVGGIAGAAGARERQGLVWAERGLAAVALVIAVFGLVAVVGNPFHRISKEYDDFVNLRVGGGGNTRFLSGGGYRYDYWRIAWKEFKQEPLRGVGAGSYDVDYWTSRRTNEDIRQPHSLPLQLLAELGIPGLLALLALVGAVAVGLWRTARRGVTSPWRRAAAVAAGGAFAAWLAHTSVDWLHLFPGVTGVAICAAAGLLAPWTRSQPGRALAGGRILALVLTVVAVLAAADLIGRVAAAEHYRLQAKAQLNTDPVTALKSANQALALNPDSLNALYMKSAAYARLGRYRLARAALLQATRTEPHNPEPWALLGDLAVRRGSFHVAKLAYATSVRLNPKDSITAGFAKNPRSALPQGP